MNGLLLLEKQEVTKKESSLATSAKRILIVDDETHMRTTLSDILSDEGFNVDTAADGLTAVAMCESHEYSAVLLDVRVPGIDGVETFRRIRRQHEDLRVVMMSAYGCDDLKQTALGEGAVAFLSKPLDIENVIDLIRDVHDTALLVVSADVDVCHSVRASLKPQGYRVTTSCSPYDALQLAEQIHFDIILIDVLLPEMNGLELYLALRKLTPGVVVVMLSNVGTESEQLAREAIRNTAYTLLYKPLDLAQLGGLLSRIASQRVSRAIKKPALN